MRKPIVKPITVDIPNDPQSFTVSVPKNVPEINAEIQSFAIALNDNLLVATTEDWDSRRELIGQKNVVYVYTDHETNEEGQPVPGFKVGDGLAYLIDLPFNDDLAIRHIYNTGIHVTPEEKEFWNNKVTAYINASDTEQLILTKN